MSSLKVPFKIKAALSLRSILNILLRPWYAAIAVLIGFLLLGLLVWITNFSLLLSLWLNGAVSLGAKFSFFLNGYASLFSNYTVIGAAILVVFAVLSGINLSVLVFVISKSLRQALSGSTRNIGAIIAAIVGAGCAACGTSFFAPFLTGISATVSVPLVSGIGVLANLVGIALLLFSIFELGAQASTLLVTED